MNFRISNKLMTGRKLSLLMLAALVFAANACQTGNIKTKESVITTKETKVTGEVTAQTVVTKKEDATQAKTETRPNPIDEAENDANWQPAKEPQENTKKKDQLEGVKIRKLLADGMTPGNFRVTPGTLWWGAVGDVMVHDRMLNDSYRRDCKCYDYDTMFEYIKPELQKFDILSGNLETTLPGKNYKGYPQFASPDSLAHALKASGFDIITTANNHTADTYKLGVIRTLKVLDRLDLVRLGSYKTIEEYKENRILIVEKNDLKIAMLNYTFSLNGLPIPKGTHINMINKKQIAADLELARKAKPDSIIVFYHYGSEYVNHPDKSQVDLVKYAFHHGADIVLGGHSHTVQPYVMKEVTDKYGETRKRLVIYSLGNFISSMTPLYTKGGVIFSFRLNKQENARAQIAQVDAKLLWITHRHGKTNPRYRALDIEQVLADRKKPKKDQKFADMSKFEFRRMSTYYKNVKKLLQPGQKQIDDYLAKKELADSES